MRLGHSRCLVWRRAQPDPYEIRFFNRRMAQTLYYLTNP